MAMVKAKKSAKAPWFRVMKDAIDADTWGQALEAIDEYEKLGMMLDGVLSQLPDLTVDERSTISKIRLSIKLRIEALQDVNGNGIKLDEAKRLIPVLEDLFERPQKPFPIPLHNYDMTAPTIKGPGEESEMESDSVFTSEQKDFSIPRPHVNAKAGTTTMAILIDKIGLKDAQTYIEAHLTASVVDATGQTQLETYDTPRSNKMKPNYVTFNEMIYLQTPLGDFANQGHTLFFEFKHFKPKKKKVSTRCFAFMEYEEIIQANGNPTCLELYKKPTDFTKRRINLFTIKPLFLHLTITFHKH